MSPRITRVLVITLFGLSVLLVSWGARGDDAGDEYDAFTLRASDMPVDAPRFGQYPATLYRGPVARPDVHSHRLSRLFRTMIRLRLKEEGANFAGHMSLVTWGCGMCCRGLAFVDTRNGRVYHPENLQTVDCNNIAYDDFLDAAGEWDLLRFRPDSRLLVVIGGINEEGARRGISYFVWKKNRLQRIRFVHKAYE